MLKRYGKALRHSSGYAYRKRTCGIPMSDHLNVDDAEDRERQSACPRREAGLPGVQEGCRYRLSKLLSGFNDAPKLMSWKIVATFVLRGRRLARPRSHS